MNAPFLFPISGPKRRSRDRLLLLQGRRRRHRKKVKEKTHLLAYYGYTAIGHAKNTC